MIASEDFCSMLAAEGVTFFTGVPDSLLKEFCAHLARTKSATEHVIAANEGTAVGLAAGHHLATGAVPAIYLQNSGLGNTVNPLLSLADPEVYALPMVLLIGWRGMPGVKDEPQHVKQGRVSPDLLAALEVPHRVLESGATAAEDAVRWAVRTAVERSGPTALLVAKGVFGEIDASDPTPTPLSALRRERAIEIILEALDTTVPIIGTTGMISRELYESRRRAKQDGALDFLTVGSMGHASQIAAGIALAQSAEEGRDVVCLDGDGAMLMHMGGVATLGGLARRLSGLNLFHIVLNNGVHDSVGGQETTAGDLNLTAVAQACGYDRVIGPVLDDETLRQALADSTDLPGLRFLEVRVARGVRPDLGRPAESPIDNKRRFMTGIGTAATAGVRQCRDR